MTLRKPLAVVCLAAALHGLFFIWYQRPDWTTQWSDQEGYRRLGQVLAETGKFTRFPDASRFVPEVIRTPVYPAFVAAIYRVFGAGQLPVALAQTALFVLLCVVTYRIARRIVPETMGVAAAFVVALFPPFPYFGALVMTEVWTTVLFTVAMALAVRAVREQRTSDFAWLGLVLALATLSRPVFVLFPFALAGVGLVIFPLLRIRPRPTLAAWAAMIAVFAVGMLPWFTYNYVTMGRFTLSPAGGIGRGMWEGTWQATWSGRVQNELTHLADDIDDRAELDRRVTAVAERERLPAGPMLEYVHQWEDIRRIWVEPADPYERAMARVKADEEYHRVARENIHADSIDHFTRRLARGVFILWAGEIPFRYSEINALPPIVIYVCWALQAMVMLLAFAGIAALARAGRLADACLLAAPILYITAVHFPLLTEARQSLPAMPMVLLLATIGAARIVRPSLALEPQVHERQHLSQP
jgi:4-amino-4-deoxy-L-arabinose transferase-like glycosyltransferase